MCKRSNYNIIHGISSYVHRSPTQINYQEHEKFLELGFGYRVIERLIKPAIVDDTPKGQKLMMIGTADEIVKVSKKGPVFVEDLSKEEQVADMVRNFTAKLGDFRCALGCCSRSNSSMSKSSSLCSVWSWRSYFLPGKVALPRGRTDKGDTNDIRAALRKAEKEIRFDLA
ncbi:hypothetical protein Tco_1285434 [Tanacetum coccineum]